MNQPNTPSAFPSETSDGMRLRDFFAAQALPGLFAVADDWRLEDPESVARAAYSLADAMMEARKA